MDKDLQFGPGTAADGADLFQAEFTGQVQPPHALAGPEAGAGRIGDVGLGGEVNRQLRYHLRSQGEDARVGDDQAIGAGVAEFPQVRLQVHKIAVVGEDVDRDVGLDAVVVSVGQGSTQSGGIEIGGPGAQAEVPAAQVDGVCAIAHGGDEFLVAAGRGQQFGETPGAAAGRGCIVHGKDKGKWLMKTIAGRPLSRPCGMERGRPGQEQLRGGRHMRYCLNETCD